MGFSCWTESTKSTPVLGKARNGRNKPSRSDWCGHGVRSSHWIPFRFVWKFGKSKILGENMVQIKPCSFRAFFGPPFLGLRGSSCSATAAPFSSWGKVDRPWIFRAHHFAVASAGGVSPVPGCPLVWDRDPHLIASLFSGCWNHQRMWWRPFAIVLQEL